MNIHVRIWKMFTNKVAALLPEYTVVRTYDAVAKFELVQDSHSPQCFVTLEAKSRERLSNQKIFDVYEFLVWLIAPLDESDEMAAMDARLSDLDTLADAFSLKRLVLEDEAGSVVLIADEETETVGNNPFELNELVELKLFCVRFGVTIKHERRG